MAKTSVSPTPEGMHSLTPHLMCDGAADAIAFHVRAFGAVEEMRLPGSDGKLMHARIRIGDSALMLVDVFPERGMRGPKSLAGSPVTIHLFVEDVDVNLAQSVAAGGTITKMRQTIAAMREG